MRRSQRGSGMLVVMVFGGICALIALGWWAVSDFQQRAIARRIATNVGKDKNAFALELINEMIRHRTLSGTTLPPPHAATTTFWEMIPVAGWDWAFTNGYDKTSGETPVAFLRVNVCDARSLKFKNPANDLLAAYSSTPRLPTACTKQPVDVIMENFKNGSFLHVLPSVVVPL